MRAWPVAIAAVAVSLAGCAGLLPKPPPPPALYRLTAAKDFPASGIASTQLAIDVPRADAALDTTRIVLSRSPTSLDYFADSAWTDRLSLMLQARLIDSFDNAHRLVAFTAATTAAQPEAILVIDLRHFEAQYGSAGPPRWRIELTADLIAVADRKTIATRTFAATAAASRNDMSAIVDAADRAWRGVEIRIVDWADAALARRGR